MIEASITCLPACRKESQAGAHFRYNIDESLLVCAIISQGGHLISDIHALSFSQPRDNQLAGQSLRVAIRKSSKEVLLKPELKAEDETVRLRRG